MEDMLEEGWRKFEGNDDESWGKSEEMLCSALFFSLVKGIFISRIRFLAISEDFSKFLSLPFYLFVLITLGSLSSLLRYLKTLPPPSTPPPPPSPSASPPPREGGKDRGVGEGEGGGVGVRGEGFNSSSS